MPDDKQKMETVGIQFSKETREWLDKERIAQGNSSISHVVRLAVAYYILKKDKERKKK